MRFEAPEHWELEKVDAAYLLLAQEGVPTLELKWAEVNGAFDPRAHLRRLGRRVGRALPPKVRENPLPPDWDEALCDYKRIGFSWQGPSMAGQGAVLYCPICRRATLVQFYKKPGRPNPPQARRLLASLRDHQDDGLVLWSLFDIRALIPEEFTLSGHRFDAGAFEMTFSLNKNRISLFRWGPAAVLLGKGDLIDFAHRMLHPPASSTPTGGEGSLTRVEWATGSDLKQPRGWRRWIRKRPPHQRLRVWQAVGRNRILGVRMLGSRSCDQTFFDRICAAYEIC